MANFFAKPKAGSSIPLTARKESTESTDFDKVFKPFALRKGVQVAPTNHFGAHRRLLGGVEENPTVLLDNEIPPPSPPTPVIRSPPANSLGLFHASLSHRIPLTPHSKILSAI